MSDQLVEPGNAAQRGSPENSTGTAAAIPASEVLAQVTPTISADEMHQVRRSTSSSQRDRSIHQELQDSLDASGKGTKESADRQREKEEEIWAALRQQDISQIDAANLTKELASNHKHTAGANKKLSAEELGKLLDSQDTDLALVRNRSVAEKKLYEATSEIHSLLGRVATSPDESTIGKAREKIQQYIESSGVPAEEALKRLDRAMAMQGTSLPLNQFVRQYGLASSATPEPVQPTSAQPVSPQPIPAQPASPAVSYEVQKLAGVLTAAEMTTISTVLQHAKDSGHESSIKERDRREVARILEQIAQDSQRSALLGVKSGDSQVVAHQLANRVFDHNGGALLAQIFVQSNVSESTVLRQSSAAAAQPPEQAQRTAPVKPEAEPLTPEQQRTLILQQVALAAQQQAQSDFARSPSNVADQRTVKITLHGILNRHPELQDDPQIQKLMLEKFQSSYQEKIQEHFKSMSFIEGFYYGVQRRWAENFAQIGAFFERAVEAVKKLPETVLSYAEKAVTTVKDTVFAVYSWGEAVVTFVTSPATWIKAGEMIKGAYNFITDPQTWISLGEMIKSGVTTTWNVLSDPQTWKNLGTTLWNIGEASLTFCYNVLTDPQKAWEAIKSVGHFLYDVGKSLGVNDLLWGVYKFAEGTVRLAAAPFQFGFSMLKNGTLLLCGQQSFDECCAHMSRDFSDSFGEAVSCLAESTVAIKGAVLVLGELTGITDCIMCAYYLSQGNWAMAGMHGAFALMSWGSIAATIATGGAAIGAVAAVSTGRMTMMQGLRSVGKVALSQFAKEGVEVLGKETGEKVMKTIGQELGGELEKKVVSMTGRIVEDGVSELASQVAKLGKEALVGKNALKQVEEMFSGFAYKHTSELLKDLKVYDHVKSSVLELLKSIQSAPLKTIEERMVKMGLTEEAAKASAAAVRTALLRGVSDKEMAEILTTQITKEITDRLTKEMEKPFRELFERALRGELETVAGKKLAFEMRKKGIKLTESEISELVKAGWKGCREGVERAVREVVELAVKHAFEEFRRSRGRFPGLDLNFPITRSASKGVVLEELEESRSEEKRAKGPGEREFDVEKRKKVTRSKTTLLAEKTEELEEDVV